MANSEHCLNLRQIEVFRAVMMAGSVTAAARTLRISQPAVSRLLRYTEDRLAAPLFSRVKGRIYPTAQARVLYEEVEKVYKGLDSVQDVARTLADNLVGQLRIVAIQLLILLSSRRVLPAFAGNGSTSRSGCRLFRKPTSSSSW